MHRLLFLFGALALALFAQHILRADEFAPYVLRDGLLLSAVALILFAAHALPLPTRSPIATKYSPSRRSHISTIWMITGLLCLFASGMLFALRPPGLALASLRTTLWLLGIAGLLIGGFWPRVVTGLGTVTHLWRRGEKGDFVRVPIERMENDTPTHASTMGSNAPDTPEPLLPSVQEWGLLALLTGLALGMRLWDLSALPAGCLATECTRLAELAGVPGTVPWYATTPTNWILQFILRGTEADVRALRLFGALLGTATLPIWYGFVRQIVRPGGALAGAAVLALSPWHVRASASADPWIALPLLLALGGWALLWAWRSDRLYASAFAALGWGLLLAEAGSARLPLLIWLLLACAIGAFVLRSLPLLPRIGRVLLWGVGATAVAAPWLVTGWRLPGAPTGFGDLLYTPSAWLPMDLLTALLRGAAAGMGATAGDALPGALSAALAILGLGVLLRHFRVPAALFVLIGTLLCAWIGLASTAQPAPTQGGSALLLWLPLLYALTAVASDQLVVAFQHAWRTLVPPQRVVRTLPVLLVLLLLPGAVGTIGVVQMPNSGANSQLGSAMGRYLSQTLIRTGADATASLDALYFVPPALLQDAGLRAEVGADFQTFREAGIIRPLDPVPALFLTPTGATGTAPTHTMVYLVPVREPELLALLGRLYPHSTPQLQMSEPGADGASGEPIFAVFSVSAQGRASVQGVQATFFPAELSGSATLPLASTSAPSTSAPSLLEPTRPVTQTAAAVLANADLAFDWDAEPPLPAPFRARWSGLLLVPQAGNYRFFVDTPAPDGTGADERTTAADSVRLYLDDRRLLDSAVGVLERQEALAQGAYQLEVLYHSGAADGAERGFEILWQRPGGPVEAIPRELLRNTPGAGYGLLGTYFANDTLSGPSLLVRKDPLVGMVADLLQPYSVRWDGLFAAARAGEYLFGGVSSGQFQIAINGRTIVTKQAVSTPGIDEDSGETADVVANSYAEGLIYLPMGWHTIEIEHAPLAINPSNNATDDQMPYADTSSGLQLFWQPPGGTPDRLPNRYLTAAMNAPLPATLPTAPTLSAPNLGTDRFALTIAPEFRNPQTQAPPDSLPPLDPQLLWQSGSCGSGPQQLNGPRGVALDPMGGRIYVADMGNRRLAVFGLDGTLVEHVESEQFQEPFDVDLLPAGDGDAAAVPLVLDALAEQVWRIERNAGTYSVVPLSLNTSFYRPRGLGVDASGIIGVADTGGGRIVLFAPDGNVLIEFGGRETALGSGQPVDVLFANGRSWGMTAENGRLWRLDTSLPGSMPSLLAAQPSNTFDAPHFAGLPDGSFYLTDPARRSILYYSVQGQPLRQWPPTDALMAPVGIDAAVVNGATHVVVTDSAACTVSLWRLNE